MTAADRGRLVQKLQLLAAQADEQFAELDRLDSKAAGVLASGWYQCAQVWREKLAEVQR